MHLVVPLVRSPQLRIFAAGCDERVSGVCTWIRSFGGHAIPDRDGVFLVEALLGLCVSPCGVSVSQPVERLTRAVVLVVVVVPGLD